MLQIYKYDSFQVGFHSKGAGVDWENACWVVDCGGWNQHNTYSVFIDNYALLY